MKELVEQLLFLARGDNDSLVVEPEVFDLTAVAGQVMRDSQVIDQTHPMEASWEQPVFVNCDLGLTKQAIRILVDNAAKYTPEGGTVTLSAAVEDDVVRIRVRDTGVGISKEDLPHVFDRFYKVDKSHHGKGTGLGLAIAYEIMKHLGEEMSVTSELNQGSCFTFTLHIAKPSGFPSKIA